MSSFALKLLLVALLAVLVAGCTAVVGIFKAGFWVGVIAVVVIVGLLFLAFSRG